MADPPVNSKNRRIRGTGSDVVTQKDSVLLKRHIPLSSEESQRQRTTRLYR